MLAGKKVKACSHCYYQKSIGQTSYRESCNKEWLNSPSGQEIVRRVEYSQKNDGRVDLPPLYFDFRWDNLCNLKCRMCNLENSSKIWQEQKELLKEKTKIASLVDTSYYNRKHNKQIKFFHGWRETPKLWDTVLSWLPGIKRLYLTGGEPTLVRRNWELLDYLKAKDLSKNIQLDFNLNCTHVPDKLLNIFKDFDSVNLRLSIDGYGKVQEYIRSPSKWRVIEKNVRKLLKNRTKGVSITFTPVIQVYNILGLTDLLKWIHSLKKEFEFFELPFYIMHRT